MLHSHTKFSKAAVKIGSKGKEITGVVSLPLDVGVLVSGIFQGIRSRLLVPLVENTSLFFLTVWSQIILAIS